MKIKANNYKPQEIIRIIREWTELSQNEFAKTVNRSKSSIQAYEQGVRHCSLDTLLQIANTHEISITIEKKARY